MIKIETHKRNLKDVKKEGVILGKYYSRETYHYASGAVIYIEYLKRWGDQVKFARVWSFGDEKNFVTDVVPIQMAQTAKEAILKKIRG